MAELNAAPVQDADFAAALEQIKALLQGGQGDVTTEDVMAAPPMRERAPVRTMMGTQPMSRDPMAGVTVDWSEPQADRPRAPQPRSYASSAGSPFGDLVASYTDSNALGRGVSGIEDFGGGVGNTAYMFSGIPGAMDAGRNLGEAEASGDPFRGAAAIGQGALSTLPYNRLAGAVMATAPGALAAGAAFAGIPIAAATTFMPNEAQAQARGRKQPVAAPQPAGPPPDDGLQPEQRARRDELNTQLTREQWLPPVQRRELESLTKIMTDFQTARNTARTDADKLRALEKAKLEGEEASNKALRQREADLANQPFRERYGPVAGNLPATGLALSAGLPFALRGMANAGTWMPGSMSRRLDRVTNEAVATADPRQYTISTSEIARLLEQQPTWLNTLGKAGVSALAGGALTAEANLFPDQYDAFNLTPGSPAQNMARDRALSLWPYLERGAIGTLTGMSGYKAGDLVPYRRPNTARAQGVLDAGPPPAPTPNQPAPVWDDRVNRWRLRGTFHSGPKE